MSSHSVTVDFTADQLALLVAGAERRSMTVSDYIRTVAMNAARPRLSRVERDERIIEYLALGWSNKEIAVRLGIDRETVAARAAVLRPAVNIQDQRRSHG